MPEKQKMPKELQAKKEQAEARLFQEQYKLNYLENWLYCHEQGKRAKCTHRLCNLGRAIESLALEERKDRLYQKYLRHKADGV